MIESPRSSIISEECRKAASQNGYRCPLGEVSRCVHHGSTTAKCTILLGTSGARGRWFLAIDHVGITEELERPQTYIRGLGIVRYAYATPAEIHPYCPMRTL